MLGRLDQETEHRLQNLCEQTGYTKSYYAKKALRELLEDWEDYLLGIAGTRKT